MLFTSAMVRPKTPAFSRSMSNLYCGSSLRPLGRTATSAGSFAAAPRSWLRASISFAWPRLPRSNSSKSKPVALPSSMTDGGAKAKASASWIFAKWAMARPAMACTRCCEPGRCDQSLSRTKARPELCPRPPKLKPATVKTPSTESFSWVRKYSRTSSSTASVRLTAAPGGVFTCTKRCPGPSSGRKELGTRVKRKAMPSTSTP